MSDSTSIYDPSDERIPIGTRVRSRLKTRLKIPGYYGRVVRHSVECKGYPNIVRWQGNVADDEACSINELEIVGE